MNIFCNEYLSIDGKYSSASEFADCSWCPFSRCGHCMWFWYHEAIVETLALSKGPRASWSYRRRHATVAEAPREGKGPDGRVAITQLNIPEIQSCGYHAAEAWARLYYMFLLFPVFLQIFPCICVYAKALYLILDFTVTKETACLKCLLFDKCF